jgi:hypothetical protein
MHTRLACKQCSQDDNLLCQQKSSLKSQESCTLDLFRLSFRNKQIFKKSKATLCASLVSESNVKESLETELTILSLRKLFIWIINYSTLYSHCVITHLLVICSSLLKLKLSWHIVFSVSSLWCMHSIREFVLKLESSEVRNTFTTVNHFPVYELRIAY